MFQILKTILPNNNQKYELNHILIDDENMVATDTKIMIIKKHDFDFKKKPFLILNNKTKMSIKAEGIELEEKVNFSMAQNYPDYRRIMLNTNKTKVYIPKYYEFIDCLCELSYKFGFIFNWKDYATKYKKIDKLLPKIKKVYYTSENAPVMIIAEEYIIIIMPIKLHLIQY